MSRDCVCDKIRMTNKHKSNLSSNRTQVFINKKINKYIYIKRKKKKNTGLTKVTMRCFVPINFAKRKILNFEQNQNYHVGSFFFF